MNKQRKHVIETNEISEVCEVTLRGYKQKIMLDGKKSTNPVVICLHGGPGSPLPFCVGSRGLFPDITEGFTLVCWDQLGCGINNLIIDDSFHVCSFVDMTVELVKYVKEHFKDNKVYLFGISWGSLLAAEAAYAAQDLLDGVVCYGQVLHDMTFNNVVFSALEASHMPDSKKKKLNAIKDKVTADNARMIMSWINKYTDGYFYKGKSASGEKSPMLPMIIGLMTSPDYKFRDFKAVMVNGYMKNHSLIEDFLHADVRDKLSSLAIPYTIVQGSTDIVTPTAIVKEYVTDNKNDNLRLRIINDNGHVPNISGTQAVIDEIISMSSK